MKKIFVGVLISLSLLFQGYMQGISKAEAINTNSYNNSTAKTYATAATVSDRHINFSGIPGKIKNIFYAGGSRVIICTDRLYLYDTAKGKTIAKAVNGTLEDARCWNLANGYSILGRAPKKSGNSGGGFSASTGLPRYLSVFYDRSLKKKSSIDFSKLLKDKKEPVLQETISFSNDGGYAAFATPSGLYLYNIKSGKKSRLINFKGNNAKARKGLCGIDRLGFTNGGRSLVFKGQSFDVPVIKDKPSFDTFGSIGVDGRNLQNRKMNGYAVKELTAYDTKLLLAEDFTTASGKLMVMDSKNGKYHIINLASKSEGGNIYGSDGGKYFVSSISDKSCATVRIYSTDTGKLLSTHAVSYGGKTEYGYHDPIMLVLDKTRTCVVLFGAAETDIKTKVTAFGF